jgi:hypothetical protein
MTTTATKPTKKGTTNMKTKSPKIPSREDYRKAFKAICVLRDFYKHDYHTDKDVEPNSYFGKKAKIMEKALSLLPGCVRNNC